ncbi:isocitrate lyase/phosphoenolpyruvate mutase family protein [Paraflavitalea speifideaquila]|uniref:isocitrate lyase/PEP mutase family protein n=1 Tax=Paraflavitalea speifideaquila TaxID=3076558 RepID=UPI0028E7E231|nr:isocitrate lyase/phosphoenolpyruvate mutase family protein [Paraflavitalea speifideiaquila]
MPSLFDHFNNLHHTPNLFVLPNAWNPASARWLQDNHYPAIATSSAAVANSLGYADGEDMPFADYLFIIKRILSSVTIPVSVDIEMGYAASDEAIYTNIQQLIDLGVVGINIEDSTLLKTGRSLKNANTFARTIDYLSNQLATQHVNLFINIRCDTFILNVENKLQETLQRLKLYETTGAHGIFLPCIAEETDIKTVVSHTHLPLNIMSIPDLPGFDTLNNWGVKRVSMGPFLFNKVYDQVGALAQATRTTNNLSPCFPEIVLFNHQ